MSIFLHIRHQFVAILIVFVLVGSNGEAQVHSLGSGFWSDPAIWSSGGIPGQAEDVLIDSGHVVTYDLLSSVEIRSIHIRGTLTFSRAADTQLDVGMIVITTNEHLDLNMDCSATHGGHPWLGVPAPALEVGTQDDPIPSGITARIRLTYFPDLDEDCAPGIVCYGGRMDFHGKPIARTWVQLTEGISAGSTNITLADPVDWDPGDRVIVTGSWKPPGNFIELLSYRTNGLAQTEEREVVFVSGNVLTIDEPLEFDHLFEPGFGSEVAVLSRNVIVESKDPNGVRGHTMYHEGSRGSISYAEFAHLGKEGHLARYPIHFHVVQSSMRGSSVVGASIWDSHNRFLTIHRTNYLVVRDCVGYQSVGHGFYLEDATEVFNYFDRNLSVQAYDSNPLPGQALTYDQNEGAGFWWANGWNAHTRNVATECDQYGFQFDIRPEIVRTIMQPDGSLRSNVQVNTLSFIRFSNNRAHGVLDYGFFGNGDAAENDPFVISNFKVWQGHYAMESDINNFWITNMAMWHTTEGWDTGHHKNGRIERVTGLGVVTPFTFYQAPQGLITLEDITFDVVGEHPFRIIGNWPRELACDIHIRNYSITNVSNGNNGVAADDESLPEPDLTLYLHDWFGPDQDAKVIPVAQDRDDSLLYQDLSPIFRSDTKVATVNIPFPVSPITKEDLRPPVTVILYPSSEQVFPTGTDEITVVGACVDASDIVSVTVNGIPATPLMENYGLWEATLEGLQQGPFNIVALAEDEYGNEDPNPHHVIVGIGSFPLSVDGEVADVPLNTEIFQNYPNPFNSTTTIQYNLATGSFVSIRIYDILGQEIVELVKSHKEAGSHRVEWDGTNSMGHQSPTGTYLVTATANGSPEIKKIVLLK